MATNSDPSVNDQRAIDTFLANESLPTVIARWFMIHRLGRRAWRAFR